MAADDSADDANARKGIDPRYDPVFQRGYRGDARTSVRSSARRNDRVDKQRDARTDAAVADAVQARRERSGTDPGMPTIQNAAEEAAAGRVAPVGSADLAPAGGADVAEDVAIDVEHLNAPPARANPFIVALWIIGVGLTVLGVTYQVWAQSHAGSFSYSAAAGVPIEVVLINMAYTVSTPAITVGLATIVGLLFLHGIGFRSRKLR